MNDTERPIVIAERLKKRGFFGTWLILFQRHSFLLAVLVLCTVILGHLIATSLPTTQPVPASEILGNLAKPFVTATATEQYIPVDDVKRGIFSAAALENSSKWIVDNSRWIFGRSVPSTLDGKTAHNENSLGSSSHIQLQSDVSIASDPASYWQKLAKSPLNPRKMGLREVVPHLWFEPSLWEPTLLVQGSSGAVTAKRALPTNAWWIPWVMAPGVGRDFVVNQHPYAVSVLAKSRSSDSANSFAGLQILAPLTELVMNTADGSAGTVFGISQALGDSQSGLQIGLSLADDGELVERHLVEDYGPLHVVKRWDIKAFHRGNDGMPVVDQPMVSASMRSHVVQGSGYIDIDLPAGVYFTMRTVMASVKNGKKNGFAKLTKLGGSVREPQRSCAGVGKVPLSTEVLEIELDDRTRWVLIMDGQVELTCYSTTEGDVIQTTVALAEPLAVRVAIISLSHHPDLNSMPHTENLSIAPLTERMSDLRWRLMGHINRYNRGSAAAFVAAINKLNGTIQDNLLTTLTHFPLREHLTALGKLMKFTVDEAKWGPELLEYLGKYGSELDAILVPEGFARSAPEVAITPELRSALVTDFIEKYGGGIITFAGLQQGTTKTLLGEVFSIWLESRGTWRPLLDPAIHKNYRDIVNLVPTDGDTPSPVAPRTLPRNMPAYMKAPVAGAVELLETSGGGWPFVAYCRGVAVGASSEDSDNCDGAAAAFWYYGAGTVQWLGLDFNGGAQGKMEPQNSDWFVLLQRALTSVGCAEKKRKQGMCVPPKRILLVTESALEETFKDVELLMQLLVASEKTSTGVRDIADVDMTINFLRGTKELYTGNIDNEKLVVADSQAETLKDFVLRHALARPRAASVEAEVGEESALLRYQIEVKSLIKPSQMQGAKSRELEENPWMPQGADRPGESKPPDVAVETADESFPGRPGLAGTPSPSQDKTAAVEQPGDDFGEDNPFRVHTLYPPSGKNANDALYNPYRAMIYVTGLHRKLEYRESVAALITSETSSLEDDITMCLPSTIGPLCARSFGLSPRCRIPSPLEGTLTSGRPTCTFDSDGKLEAKWYNPVKHVQQLEQGHSTVMSYQRAGAPTAILINFPLTTFDHYAANSNGEKVSLLEAIPIPWHDRIRWAVREDLRGVWRLDGAVWLKPEAADDVGRWVRRIHRYAQIALAADAVGVTQERTLALSWVKAALENLFTDKFEGKALLYDALRGGIVPCGCNRETGGEGQLCVPPPRAHYFEVAASSSEDTWLAASCPALKDVTVSSGAGAYDGHLALWGYIVHCAAVVGHFEPRWLNKKLRIEGKGGFSRPKIHHIILGLIQDYANPTIMQPFDAQTNPDHALFLTHWFPPARHKDWYRLHSYTSGLTSVMGGAPHINSASEAAFAYWAVALYGEVTGDRDLMQWGRLLAGSEIAASNKWWHATEYSEALPPGVRYLGAVGQVSALSLTFQTKFGTTSYDVYQDQVLPLTLFSFEFLDPGWALWMTERWEAACQNDLGGCSKHGTDIGQTLLDIFVTDWEVRTI